MNISLGKSARVIGQIALMILVIIVGLIVLGAIADAYYFQPDNLLGDILPEFSETLMDAWGTGVAVILVLQSLLLMITGMAFLLRHWQSIRGGRSTFWLQFTLMALIVGLCLAVTLMLFRATSLVGGSSPVGVWVPVTITVSGLIQSAVSMMVIGPHYNML
ncbi:MAG: hypothetical protein AB1Z19_01550 [Eubacteriales bacterium]